MQRPIKRDFGINAPKIKNTHNMKHTPLDKSTLRVSRLCVPTGKTQWQEFSQENSTRYKKAKKEPKADPTERAKDMTVMTVRDKQRHTHRPFLPRITKRAVV